VLSKVDVQTDSYMKCSSAIKKSAKSLDADELVMTVLLKTGVGSLIFSADSV